jgi:hypothetical protein
MESTISQLLTRLFWLEMIEVASAIALTTLAMMMYRAAGRRRPGTLSVRAKQSSEAGV